MKKAQKTISISVSVLWTQTQFECIDTTVTAEDMWKFGPVLLQDDPTAFYRHFPTVRDAEKRRKYSEGAKEFLCVFVCVCV